MRKVFLRRFSLRAEPKPAHLFRIQIAVQILLPFPTVALLSSEETRALCILGRNLRNTLSPALCNIGIQGRPALSLGPVSYACVYVDNSARP